MNPSQDKNALPLFALPMMVLPGETSALHIFEPRYRELITHCRAEPNPAGEFIIQYQEKERSCAYATAVSISKILHEHEDGRLDILVQGKQRVEVTDRMQLHLYPSATYQLLMDDEEGWQDDLATRVYALHRQLLVLVTGDEPADAFYSQQNGIAFKVAACSGMTFKQRLTLLKSHSENERLEMVESHLSELLPRMRETLNSAQNIAGAFTLAEM